MLGLSQIFAVREGAALVISETRSAGVSPATTRNVPARRRRYDDQIFAATLRP